MTTANQDGILSQLAATQHESPIEDDLTASQDSQVEELQSEQQEPDQTDQGERIAELEAQNKKLANDLRSEQGRRNRGQDFNQLVDGMDGLTKVVTALANSNVSGDTEALAENLNEITLSKARDAIGKQWDDTYSEAEQNLSGILVGAKGDFLLDDEAIAILISPWQEAKDQHDLPGLYRIISQAGQEVREAEVRRVEEGAKAAKKLSDTRHGVHDLGLPPPSGGGTADNLTPQERIAKGLKEHADGTKKSAMFGP